MSERVWYDKNKIEALTSAVNDFLNSDWRESKQPYILAMGEAVKPFLPDPDEELIEAIARAMYEPGDGFDPETWEEVVSAQGYIDTVTQYRRQARTALTAYREYMEKEKG